ncbi:hypothetical protein COLO4_30567 [Corchorus olitorius]|uniref:Neprosin PEP catalytic domain-containing protein n=1 Tax=Corchorus olitorius TaxID=93759 RepID=A0A1R3H7V1_9ROSI|nr:hypothetical protein COLO4_30567 [Corchorus olitorius]
MATWNHRKAKLEYSIIVFVALCHMFSYVQVHARSFSSDKNVEYLAKHKGTIKTIQSEDGDVIDCVDIYKQPAFDHPLLKNHTIQMKPSYYPKGMKLEKIEAEPFQGYIECPEGTVPIVRAQLNNTRANLFPQRKYLPEAVGYNHEYAQVSVVDGNYFGATARLNAWHPSTFNGEISIAQFWILSGLGNDRNSMEAGWIVHPDDTQTRLFAYWTSDNYQRTGCYNLECPGFVATANQWLLGARLDPISTYADKQFEFYLSVRKDKQSGNWWLRFQDKDIGYWPGSIFTGLSDRAELINWGGEILNSKSGGRHTSTQMGSGHFPSEGFGKAAFFRKLASFDESGAEINAENVQTYVSRPECYDLEIPNKNKDVWGTHFYFGGPGFSDKCK